MSADGLDIAGREDDRQVGIPPPDFARELKAADASRHHDVRQHDIDLARVGQRPERRLGAGDVRDGESQRRQELSREGGDLPVVFDQQDVAASFGVGAQRKTWQLVGRPGRGANAAAERSRSVPTPTSLSMSHTTC